MHSFTPGERTPSINWLRRWAGSKVGLDAVQKKNISCLYRESNSVSSVVMPYSLPSTNVSKNLAASIPFLFEYFPTFTRLSIHCYLSKSTKISPYWKVTLGALVRATFLGTVCELRVRTSTVRNSGAVVAATL
jgi:hypothetical protein